MKIEKVNIHLDELNKMLINIEGTTYRPSMVGLPEHIELTSKYLAHIFFLILHQDWDFDKTENFWTQVSIDVLKQRKFTSDMFESKAYREKKWGIQESVAVNKLFEIYQNIWDELNHTATFYSHARLFLIEIKDKSPICSYSPDAVADILLTLTACSIKKNHGRDLRDIHEEKCMEIKKTASRGLHDLMVSLDWNSKPPKMTELEIDYANLVFGINQIVSELKKELGKILKQGKR